MKLSKFIKECEKIYIGIDPEIRIVTEKGFEKIDYIAPRCDYYDNTFFGTKLKKGKFICIELKQEI